jgi:NAD(P)H-dependent flavin oxidoreductase YrpB (nitropropane dioxygenase family)
MFPQLTIGDKTIPVPIIQGGMGIGVSLNNLASAVANEGGVGVIAGPLIGFRENNFAQDPVEAGRLALVKEIRQAREKSRGAPGLLGYNTMMAGSMVHFASQVRTALEEKIDLIFIGAGLPLDLPAYLREAAEKAQAEIQTKLAPIVSSARAATIIARKWLANYNQAPDLVVVEGPKAGGHLGLKMDVLEALEHQLEVLISQVLEAVKPFEDKAGRAVPVIGGGGIYTGGDIYELMKLGAAGVQMGTRFVATWECDAALAFKKAYLEADSQMVFHSPAGMPGRAVRSKFLEDVEKGLKKPFHCMFQCLRTCDPETAPYCISLALINAQRGFLERGFAFAGANVNRVCDIVSVKNLIAGLREEYEATMAAAAT